jgi:hypothetical protein
LVTSTAGDTAAEPDSGGEVDTNQDHGGRLARLDG